MSFTFENDARLILSDGHGVYIPQLFCADIDAADAARIGVDFTDVQCCQAGPTASNEWYWEAWQAILDSAVLIDGNGVRWFLYQDGDLWEYPVISPMSFTFENDARLILSDGHGVYIPQLFCADIDAADAARIGVDFTDVQCCQAGPLPSNDWYWEAWQAILDSAVLIDGNGVRWFLYQDGDLWEYPEGCELPEYL